MYVPGLLRQFPVQHMCSDINDAHDRIFLNDICRERTRLRQILKAARRGDKPSVKRACIAEFKKYVEEKASSMIVLETQACVICKADCPCYPPVREKTEAWLEMISSSCVHWSSQGSQGGWLGMQNLPVICWAIAARYPEHRADMTMLECTVQLDLQWLTKLSLGQLQWHSAKLAPKQVGIPTSGRRVWAFAASKSFSFEANPLADSVLQACILR